MEITDIHGKAYKRSGVLFLILLACFAGALMQTSLGTAIPTLMKDFNINLSTAQEATTWFLLANGMMVPLSAYLSTRMSTKWLHMLSYGVLLVGILMTAMTPSKSSAWFIFVLGRILAAIAVGIMLPLMQILIIEMFPKNKRAAAMGLSGLVVGMAPAIGPTLSGWILDKNHVILGITIWNSWRTIFVLPLAVIAIAFVLSPFLMKDIIPNEKIKLDVPSLLLSVVGFGMFLLGFTNVSSYGFGNIPNVILPICGGILLLAIFAFRQLKLEKPFLDIRVFKVKDFTISTIVLILVTMAMYGVEMMLPTYLQNVHGLSPLNSGLTLFAGALMIGVISSISGVLYNKVGIRRLAFIGFVILAIGTLPFAFLSEKTPLSLIVILYAIRMVGIAMAMMPLTTRAMAALPKDMATHGTAANNTARQISSSIVVALLTSITQNVINNNSPSGSLRTINPLLYADKILKASMDGFRLSFSIGLLFAIVGIFCALFLKNENSINNKENSINNEEEVI